MDISNNINSAIVSGTLGIQTAADDITQNSYNLASLSVQSPTSSDPQEFLANASLNQISAIRQSLPEASDGITNDLVGLSVNLTNAQASSNVVEAASGTVGTLLDILA